MTIETIATIAEDGTLTALVPRSFPRGQHRVKIVLDDEPRTEDLGDQYRRAYAGDGGLGEEFEGWEAQGVWPPE